MSKPVRLSDDVIKELDCMRQKGRSTYSSCIRGLFIKQQSPQGFLIVLYDHLEDFSICFPNGLKEVIAILRPLVLRTADGTFDSAKVVDELVKLYDSRSFYAHKSGDNGPKPLK